MNMMSHYNYNYIFLLGSEGIFTAVQGLQFVVRLEVRPSPDPAVDHVGETFPVGDLTTTSVSSHLSLSSDNIKYLPAVDHQDSWEL